MANCQQCGQPNIVPTVPIDEQADEAFVPQGGGFDDIAELIAAPTASTATAAPRQVPTAADMPPFEPASQRVRGSSAARPDTADEALLVITRRGVYAHGALLFVVALVFLAAGYWIGRGTAPLDASAAGDTPGAPNEPGVAFEGNLTYEAAPGEIKPDANAVVILVPEKRPSDHERLASRGLRPTDANAAERATAAKLVRELGGACGRARAGGDFHLAAPKTGKYFVLAISMHAKREAGRVIEFDDLRAMGNYFEHAADLIGSSRYYWSTVELTDGPPHLQYEFPAAGGPSNRPAASGRQFP
jgi:hypothetical protein